MEIGFIMSSSADILSTLKGKLDLLQANLAADSTSSSSLSSLKLGEDPSLQRKSLFDSIPRELKTEILQLCDESGRNTRLKRSMGALAAMGIADSLGHNFEFMPVCDETDFAGSYFEYPNPKPDPDLLEAPLECNSASASSSSPSIFSRVASIFARKEEIESHVPESYQSRKVAMANGVFHNPLNTFMLKPGQWTDDCSMGICQADAIIARGGEFDGANIRIWFWNWWFNGLNNAFRLDVERVNMLGGDSLSCGLGANIAASLREMDTLFLEKKTIPAKYESLKEDAGNGSLMRLAPIPIRYQYDIAAARHFAYESSLCTHPGVMAAEACALMSHIVVRALQLGDDDDSGSGSDCKNGTAADFLDRIRSEYIALIDSQVAPDSKGVIRKLLMSEEADSSTERCWNWRAPRLGLAISLQNRGPRYNGYSVSAGYFGAFSIDGLSMALHCMYHTRSFNEAIVKIINMRGDSDTTGSICGQMVGAFYGVDAIDGEWKRNLYRWDDREIELRAAILHNMARP